MDSEGESFENFEEVAAVNSEMRYLALELMKLATTKGVTFSATLKEFIENTDLLQEELSNYESHVKEPKTGKFSGRRVSHE